MKQYRITSEHFVHQGETGDADAVMDSTDLYQLKKLAGITGLLGVMVVFTGLLGEAGVIFPALIWFCISLILLVRLLAISLLIFIRLKLAVF